MTYYEMLHTKYYEVICTKYYEILHTRYYEVPQTKYFEIILCDTVCYILDAMTYYEILHTVYYENTAYYIRNIVEYCISWNTTHYILCNAIQCYELLDTEYYEMPQLRGTCVRATEPILFVTEPILFLKCYSCAARVRAKTARLPSCRQRLHSSLSPAPPERAYTNPPCGSSIAPGYAAKIVSVSRIRIE